MGEAWVNGTLCTGSDHATVNDDAFWNVPSDAFGSPADEDDQDGIWSQNEAALHAFLSVETQFRSQQVGERMVAQGLDYAGARAGLRLAGLKVTPGLWSDVQVIEAAAVAALNRKI